MSATTMDEPTKLVVVGLGNRTRTKFLPAVAPLIGSGVWSLTCGIGSLSKGDLMLDGQKVTTYASIEEADAELKTAELAYVSLPHNEYASTVHRLIDYGIDVLMEKPFTTSIVEASDLAEYAKEKSRKISVLCQRRFSTRYGALKAWIPRIGKVSAVHVEETIKIGQFGGSWRAREDAGGGVVMDLGYHMLDRLVDMFGYTDNVQNAQLIKSRSQQDYDVEDTAHIALEFPNKVQGNVVLSCAGIGKKEYFRIIGEHGTICLDTNEVSLYLIKDDELKLEDHCAAEESSQMLLRHALETYLRSPEDPRWNLDCDLDVMWLIDEIYTSDNTKEIGFFGDPNNSMRP
ncbi:MAG: hypothetical protein Q9159_001214 [Coniocarpon cinnabarinum]